MSLYLNDLGVTGGEVEDHGGPPDTCDLCKCPIAEVGFFVDGQTLEAWPTCARSATWATAWALVGVSVNYIEIATKGDGDALPGEIRIQK